MVCSSPDIGMSQSFPGIPVGEIPELIGPKRREDGTGDMIREEMPGSFEICGGVPATLRLSVTGPPMVVKSRSNRG